MCRLIIILCVILLSGCVTSSGSVQYSVTTEYDSQGSVIKTTEKWNGRSNTSALGDAGLKASQKNIDFGIQMPNATVHLKASSIIEDLQSELPDEKAAALQVLKRLTHP